MPFPELCVVIQQRDEQSVSISPSPPLATEQREPPQSSTGPYSLHSEVISGHPVVINVQKDFVSLHGCTQDLEKKTQERDSGLWLLLAAEGPGGNIRPGIMQPTYFIIIPCIGIINQ